MGQRNGRLSDQLVGRVIIVTGASAGIGRETAVMLVEAGAYVMLVARREERLHTLAAQLVDARGECQVLAGDIANPAFCQKVANETTATWGRIDVLINNAGVGQHCPMTVLTPDEITRLLNTNVAGLLIMTQQVVPVMQSQRQGQIINVSSIVGQRPLPLSGLYCASKTAVNFISRTLRMELKSDQIRVSTVYPGRTITEFGTAWIGHPGANPSTVGRVSADRVARKIIQTILNGRSEVYVTWYDWLFTHLNRLFPRTTDALVQLVAGKMLSVKPAK